MPSNSLIEVADVVAKRITADEYDTLSRTEKEIFEELCREYAQWRFEVRFMGEKTGPESWKNRKFDKKTSRLLEKFKKQFDIECSYPVS